MSRRITKTSSQGSTSNTIHKLEINGKNSARGIQIEELLNEFDGNFKIEDGNFHPLLQINSIPITNGKSGDLVEKNDKCAIREMSVRGLQINELLDLMLDATEQKDNNNNNNNNINNNQSNGNYLSYSSYESKNIYIPSPVSTPPTTPPISPTTPTTPTSGGMRQANAVAKSNSDKIEAKTTVMRSVTPISKSTNMVSFEKKRTQKTPYNANNENKSMLENEDEYILNRISNFKSKKKREISISQPNVKRNQSRDRDINEPIKVRSITIQEPETHQPVSMIPKPSSSSSITHSSPTSPILRTSKSLTHSNNKSTLQTSSFKNINTITPNDLPATTIKTPEREELLELNETNLNNLNEQNGVMNISENIQNFRNRSSSTNSSSGKLTVSTKKVTNNVPSKDLPSPPSESVAALSNIIASEMSFVKEIEFLFERFVRPLIVMNNMEGNETKIIVEKKKVKRMVLNVECLLAVHKEILFLLQKDKSIDGVIYTFSKDRIKQMEEIYTIYLCNVQSAVDLIYSEMETNPQFTNFLEDIKLLSSESDDNSDKLDLSNNYNNNNNNNNNNNSINIENSNNNNSNDINEAHHDICKLMVLPAERICKYESLLSRIIDAHSVDNSFKKQCFALHRCIIEISATLNRIYQKEEFSLKWNDLLDLEKKLNSYIPIATPGRSIIKSTYFVTKSLDNEEGRRFNVSQFVLLNDCFLQISAASLGKPESARSRSNNAKFNLRSISEYSQIQIIDVADAHCSFLAGYVTAMSGSPNDQLNSNINSMFALDAGDRAQRTFYIVNIDPSYETYEVCAQTVRQKADWIQTMRRYLVDQESFTLLWGIPRGEKIIISDSAKWPQAYIGSCRLYITPSYLLISCKMPSCFEREYIEIAQITSLQIGNNLITIYAKEKTYTFLVKNVNLIYFVLTQLHNACHRSDRSSSSSMFENPLLMSPSRRRLQSLNKLKRIHDPNFFSFTYNDEEWNGVWELALVVDLQESQLLNATNDIDNCLFRIVRGSVILSDHSRLVQNELFGINSFITGVPLGYAVRGAAGGATLLKLQNSVVRKHFKYSPEYLYKFFATLTLKLHV